MWNPSNYIVPTVYFLIADELKAHGVYGVLHGTEPGVSLIGLIPVSGQYFKRFRRNTGVILDVDRSHPPTVSSHCFNLKRSAFRNTSVRLYNICERIWRSEIRLPTHELRTFFKRYFYYVGTPSRLQRRPLKMFYESLVTIFQEDL